MPEKIENAALFLRSTLPSTLIRHENRALRKHSENGACGNSWRHDNHGISLIEFFSSTSQNCRVIVTFLNSFSVAWTGR